MAAGKGPRKRHVTAPVEFMGMWINRELRRLIEDETPIRVPHESSRLAKQQQQATTEHQGQEQQERRLSADRLQRHSRTVRDSFIPEAIGRPRPARIVLHLRRRTDVARHAVGRLHQCGNQRAIHKSEESTRRLRKQLEARIKDRKVEALRDE